MVKGDSRAGILVPRFSSAVLIGCIPDISVRAGVELDAVGGLRAHAGGVITQARSAAELNWQPVAGGTTTCRTADAGWR